MEGRFTTFGATGISSRDEFLIAEILVEAFFDSGEAGTATLALALVVSTTEDVSLSFSARRYTGFFPDAASLRGLADCSADLRGEPLDEVLTEVAVDTNVVVDARPSS